MPASRHTLLAVADLLDILPDAVVMVDANGLIAYVNPAVHTLLGYAPGELLNQPLATLVPPAAREHHDVHVAHFRREGVPTMMGTRPVLHAMHRSGRMVPVSISLCNFQFDGGERVSVAVVHNVAALQTHLDRATAQAETDARTGLGNRVRLSRRMQALLDSARPFALLHFDLARFKQLDDDHGPAAGDEALRIVGRRLCAQARDGDLVARLGGGEFVILFDGLDDAEQLHERALSVAQSLTRPLRGGDAASGLDVNIGGAISPRHGASAPGLLAAADRSMSLARQAGQPYRLAGDK